MSAQPQTKVTIALTRYDEPNWLVLEALESLARQKEVNAQVLFLDQKEEPAYWHQVSQLSSRWIRFEPIHIPSKSLYYARNYGIAQANTRFVLFIDCDAVAHERWASELAHCLSMENVAIAGSRILPRWHKKPLLLAKSRVALEQYSLFDFGTGVLDQPRIVGAGFGIDRLKLGANAYFDESLGRREGRLFGGEDSELCARALLAGFRVLYNGRSVIDHQILPARVSYAWLLRRLFYAGVSRSITGGMPQSTHQMNLWDYLFAPVVAPVYLAGYCLAKLTAIRKRTAR